MSKRETITITMRRDTHAQLKSLATQQGISMMLYLEKLVGYIKRSGIDVDAPMTHQPNKQLVALKKQTDYLVRIIKNLESKTLDPLCHSVFGIERSLYQKNSLTEGLLCPKMSEILCYPFRSKIPFGYVETASSKFARKWEPSP